MRCRDFVGELVNEKEGVKLVVGMVGRISAGKVRTSSLNDAVVPRGRRKVTVPENSSTDCT